VRHSTYLFIIVLGTIFQISVDRSSAFVFGYRNEFKKADQLARSDPETALASFQKLLSKNLPDDLKQEVYYTTGRLQLRIGRQDDAIWSFKQATVVQIESDFKAAAKIELLYLERNRNPLEIIVEILHESDGMQNKILADRAWFLAGRLRYDHAMYEDALAAFRKSVSIRAEDSRDAYDLWFLSASCNIHLKSFSDALKEIDRAIELKNWVHPDAYLQKLRIQIAMDQIQPALESFPLEDEQTISPVADQIEHIVSGLSYEQLQQVVIAPLPRPLQLILLKTTIRKAAERGLREDAQKGLEKLTQLGYQGSAEVETFIREIREYNYQRDDTVGLLVPLSGDLASIGMSIYRGATLAVQSFNAMYPNTPLRLVTKDTQEEPEIIQTEFNHLVNDEQALAIIGPIKSSSAKHVAELSSSSKIPVITPGCPNDSIPPMSNYFFRIFPSVERETFILCHYFRSVFNAHRFAIIYPDITYGQQAYTGVQRAIAGSDGTGTEIVFSARYPENTTNFSLYLNGLKAAAPDLIIVPDQSDRAAQIINHIRFMDMFNIPIGGTSEWESSDLVQIGGANVENAVYISEFPPMSGMRAQMRTEYIARFGEKPDPFALRTFEIMHLLGYARQSGIHTRDQLRMYLEGALTGLDGPAHFSKEGYFLPTMTIFRILKGRPEPVVQFVSNEFLPVEPTPTASPSPEISMSESMQSERF